MEQAYKVEAEGPHGKDLTERRSSSKPPSPRPARGEVKEKGALEGVLSSQKTEMDAVSSEDALGLASEGGGVTG